MVPDFSLDAKRINMYEAIADKLEQMILSDSIAVEQKLPSEQTLATSFGVSRPVIREALMLLKARGLISQRNGEGAFISSPNTDNIALAVDRFVKLSDTDPSSVYEARLTLETASARFAALRADRDGITSLETMHTRMTECGVGSEMRAELDARFHIRIAELSGNPLLVAYVGSLSRLIETMIRAALILEGAPGDALNYHRRIIDAIAAGDGELAAEVMRAHITMSMRNYENACAIQEKSDRKDK